MQALTFNLKEHPGKLRFHCNYRKPCVSGGDDVLVEVAFAGVCGTDLHIIDGHFPCKADGDIILGHEFSGRVVEIGTDVVNVNVGDHVSIDPNQGCMVCDNCRIGNVHFCPSGGLNNTVGIFRNGGFANFAVVPSKQVHKLHETLSLEQGALTEPISCIIHGWEKIQPISIGKRILIIGAGIIGNLWLSCFLLQGHRDVTVSEVNVIRLEHIRKHFDCTCVTPDQLSSDKSAFDFVIDCSGNGKAIEQGITLLKPGGVMCIFGMASPQTRINFSPLDLTMKELTVVGVKINPFSFAKASGIMPSMVKHFLHYEKLGIKVFLLSEFEEAIEALRKGTIAKAMFKLK